MNMKLILKNFGTQHCDTKLFLTYQTLAAKRKTEALHIALTWYLRNRRLDHPFSKIEQELGY